MIAQGEIWWAELGEPVGSEPGYRRPVLIVQCDGFNRSRIGTVLCVPLTGTLKWADTRAAVLLKASETGLSKHSAASALGLISIDRSRLSEQVGQVTRKKLEQVFTAIDAVLGR